MTSFWEASMLNEIDIDTNEWSGPVRLEEIDAQGGENGSPGFFPSWRQNTSWPVGGQIDGKMSNQATN